MTHADRVFQLVDQYEKEERIGRVVEVLGEAIEAEPTNVSYRLARGWYLDYRLGQHADAAQDFRDAREMDPLAAATHMHLFLHHALLGCWDEAERHARNAVAIDPNDPYLHHCLGRCLAQAGHFEAAAECFKKGLDIDSQQAISWQELANANRKLAGIAAAEATLRQAMSHAPSAKWLIKIANLQIVDGRPEESLKNLKEAESLQSSEMQTSMIAKFRDVANSRIAEGRTASEAGEQEEQPPD